MYLVYPDIIQYVKNDFNMDRPEYITTLRELRKNVMRQRRWRASCFPPAFFFH